METRSDLVNGLEASEVEEVVIAVVGGEGDQEQEGTGCER